MKVLGLPQEALPCTAALRFWPPATVERGPTSYLCTGFADGPEGSATLAELKKYLWMCDAFHGTGTAFKTDYAGYIQRRVDESR